MGSVRQVGKEKTKGRGGGGGGRGKAQEQRVTQTAVMDWDKETQVGADGWC